MAQLLIDGCPAEVDRADLLRKQLVVTICNNQAVRCIRFLRSQATENMSASKIDSCAIEDRLPNYFDDQVAQTIDLQTICLEPPLVGGATPYMLDFNAPFRSLSGFLAKDDSLSALLKKMGYSQFIQQINTLVFYIGDPLVI